MDALVESLEPFVRRPHQVVFGLHGNNGLIATAFQGGFIGSSRCSIRRSKTQMFQGMRKHSFEVQHSIRRQVQVIDGDASLIAAMLPPQLIDN